LDHIICRSVQQNLAERTIINKWQQELTPTNVAGVLHVTWPNAYKLLLHAFWRS
jgi:hypothetical protein